MADIKKPAVNVAEHPSVNDTRTKPNRLDLVTDPELNATFVEGQLYGRDPRMEPDRQPISVAPDAE